MVLGVYFNKGKLGFKCNFDFRARVDHKWPKILKP